MQSGLQNKDREALQSMYEKLKSRTKTDRQQEQSLKQTERMLAQDRYWDTYASEGQVQGLAQELQNFAEENAEILFGDVREMKDDTVARYASEEQKAQLQTLRARRDELKGKERKKMNRRIYDVNRQVQTELHERLDKELDERMGAMMMRDAVENTVPIPYRETLRKMQLNASGDYGVPAEERMQDVDSMLALEKTAETVRDASVRSVFAQKHLQSRLSGNALKYLKLRAERVNKARSSLTARMEKEKKKYEKKYKGVLPAQQIEQRFAERVEHYKRFQADSGHPPPSDAEARRELLHRAVKPVTYEELTRQGGALERYRGTVLDRVRSVAPGIPEMALAYQPQLALVVGERNDELRRQRKPEITQEQAEQMVQEYLSAVMEKGAFRFRCSGTVFGLIADDKMKTQMETGTSGGMNNAPVREALSSEMFGQERGLVHPTEYENYGYLGSRSDLTDMTKSGTRQYGSVSVKLNKERMRGRTTCVLGDSLDTRESSQPTPVSAPGMTAAGATAKLELLRIAHEYCSLSDEEKQKFSCLDPEEMLARIQKAELLAGRAGTAYFELQFHGDVTVRDMEEVVVSMPAKVMTKRVAGPDGKVRMETREEAAKRVIREQREALQQMIDKVEEINSHPEKYGRTGMPPLKLSVAGKLASPAMIAMIPKKYRGELE